MESSIDNEKVGGSHVVVVPDEGRTNRAVLFPNDPEDVEDGKRRHKGAEMKRQMTQEEIQLAAAGYEHLEQAKTIATENNKLDEVDITEHRLSLTEVENVLNASFDYKDPSRSYGLTSDEAAMRLKRDGPNALTPPKKKSALRKVCSAATFLDNFILSHIFFSCSIWIAF